jgi:NADH:ubiquinone oxidoreductase subunit F (NADH-binding)
MVTSNSSIARMQSLEKPPTRDELRKLDELLHPDQMFEEMVERAVRGRREAGRRTGKPR